MMQLSTINVMELGTQEWQYALLLRYGLDPLDLPNYCNGCNATFSIYHALNYKEGRFVMVCHNKLCDGFSDLFGKAFIPTHVCDDSLIFTGCAVKMPKANLDRSKSTSSTVPLEATEQKGDLVICDL